jgi:hypothetical protein
MFRFVWSIALFIVANPTASAADTKAVDQAIDKGKAFLQGRYKNPTLHDIYGIGPNALAGIAMLEARVPADDPSIKAVVAAVRDATYAENRTYQISLCILFLDRLEDPADSPLIQMLAVRLLAGQSSMGGWAYTPVEPLKQDQIQWLRNNVKPGPKPERLSKLHPSVAAYAASLNKPLVGGDDNSNTQFGILGLWAARRHGVPSDAALDLVDKRFRASQDAAGAWGYPGPVAGLASPMGNVSTPSMTCVGLLGLATGNARRIERKALKETTLKSPEAKGDSFFTAPGKKEKEKEPETPSELRDPATLKALNALGGWFAQSAAGGGVLAPSERHGDRDLYLLWSIERVCVIYSLEKLGGVNWYDVGATALLKSQGNDGSWSSSYGADVGTSFALLFLCKADLLRDVSKRFRKDNELRAGNPGTSGTEVAPMPKGGTTTTTPGTVPLPSPIEDESTKLAGQLVRTPATEWTAALHKLRDAKGADNTRGLVLAIQRLDGDRRKEAREALAERLTRMSAETLTGMMKAEDAELRRGAALAAAMKDDKAHIPDLIDRLSDDEDLVVRAAKAGLKSLSGGQDFGPKAGATKEEAKAAAAAWKAWWDKNQK